MSYILQTKLKDSNKSVFFSFHRFFNSLIFNSVLKFLYVKTHNFVLETMKKQRYLMMPIDSLLNRNSCSGLWTSSWENIPASGRISI